MRVLEVIADGHRGGAQRHVRDLLAALGREHVTLACGSPGWLTEQAEAADVAVCVIDGLSRQAAPVHWQEAIRALRDTAKGQRIELVHAHGAKALLLCKAAFATKGLALVYTSHGTATADPSRTAAERLALAGAERWRAKCVRAAIGVSKAECLLAAQSGIPKSSIHHIPNGVPIAAAPPRRQGAVRRLAFAGRLVEGKGVRVLADLLDALPSGTVLHVAGEGPLEGWLRWQATGEKAQRLEFHGWVEPLSPWLGQMDAFLLPSAKEGLPYALLEAAERALPIVAFDVGGVPDLLTEGVSGRVVPKGQGAAFVAAVRDLLAGPNRSWGWGEKAREEVGRRFSVERMQADTLGVYEQVLADGGALRRRD